MNTYTIMCEQLDDRSGEPVLDYTSNVIMEIEETAATPLSDIRDMQKSVARERGKQMK